MNANIRNSQAWLWAGDKPWIIAHRGGAGEAPENTKEAFEKAVAQGVSMIEMDVHLSADGQWVVLHDSTLIRTCGREGSVSEMRAAALEAVDAGHYWSADGGKTFPYRDAGFMIPTLESVLQRFETVPLSIEIKEASTEGIVTLAALLRSLSADARVIVGSEYHKPIAALRKLLPELPTYATKREILWLLVQMKLAKWVPWLKPRRADYCALAIPEYHKRFRIVSPPLIAEARRLGLVVHVWTINSETDVLRLAAIGVDGVVTDYPAKLRQLINDDL